MIKNPIILFDSVCNLCNGTVDFLIRKDKKKQFRFVALQSETGKKIIHKFGIHSDLDTVILIYDGEIFFESDAALKISSMLHFPWNAVKVFYIIPKKLRNAIYKLIARNRYKWFGKRNTCRLPLPAEKILFPEPDDLKL